MPASEPTVPTEKIRPAARPTGQWCDERWTMSGVAMPSATSGGPNRTRLAANDCEKNARSAPSWVYSSGPASHSQNQGPHHATSNP